MVTARSGFTLIELLVVLAIIGFVFAIAAPHLQLAFPQAELRSSTREIAAALREARSRAIRSNAEVVFNLDVDKRLFAISGDRQYQPLPQSTSLRLYTARQELLDGSSGNIRFFPDGSSSGGHIVLSNARSTYQVTINWLTGRVEIQD